MLISLDFKVHILFYNPNIAPHDEYLRRLDELKRYCSEKDQNLIVGGYDNEKWSAGIEPYKMLGERSERCRVCFRIRLDETFARARELGIGSVTTTLSVSPHKDAEMINSVGLELSSIYGIDFIRSDFKMNDGYKKSVEISKEYGFYRQGYCGCIYSRTERENKSGQGKKRDREPQ